MPRIHRLDPALVNKIAAGEVIERPASVVKELIENAIDAGATRIDVALAEGGARLIRVSDDGHGIAREDLPLAVAAHATSKLHTAEDLFRVRTMGFRGEALASIASVSHLTLRSRTAEQTEGYELTIDIERPACGTGFQPVSSDPVANAAPHSKAFIENAGSMPSAPEIRLTACAAPVGTTVEVRQLFYNVPARRKFLRQAPTELANVTEILARLALAHPHIAFSLNHNDRPVRSLPVTADRKTRIADFYGVELSQCLLPIARRERGLTIDALIAPPAESRASSKWQYLFLNGRFITDRRIGYAIREAYRGLVEPGRYPVVFIFLTADPGDYDVNVHPTKIEVRWKDAGLVQSQVLAVLRETLLSHDLTPGFNLQRTTLGGPRPIVTDPTETDDLPASPADPTHQQRARQALADYLKSVDPTQSRLRFDPPPFPTRNLRPSIRGTIVSPERHEQWPVMRSLPEPIESNQSAPASSDASTSSVAPLARGGIQPPDSGLPIGQALETASADLTPRADSDLNPSIPRSLNPSSDVDVSTLGRLDVSGSQAIQIHNTYLVAQTADGIIIVDQHALHERILYERFRERLLAGPLESQRLLIPQTLSVSPGQAQAAEQNQPLLWRLGIELNAIGPKALAVQSFPMLLAGVEIETFVADLLDRLAETDAAESEETHIHQALDMMACKAAVKAGDILTPEEIQTLLAQRDLVERSSNCPHGRPTTLQLTTRDLERQFKRV